MLGMALKHSKTCILADRDEASIDSRATMTQEMSHHVMRNVIRISEFLYGLMAPPEKCLPSQTLAQSLQISAQKLKSCATHRLNFVTSGATLQYIAFLARCKYAATHCLQRLTIFIYHFLELTLNDWSCRARSPQKLSREFQEKLSSKRIAWSSTMCQSRAQDHLSVSVLCCYLNTDSKSR